MTSPIPVGGNSADNRGIPVDDSALAEAKRFGITVTFGRVPFDLRVDPPRPWWLQVTDTEVLVRLPRQMRVLVSRGSGVILQLPEDADPTQDMTWVFTTWAMPIALMQRGLLNLHAATVSVGDKALALAGPSGAGKSTTAWGLRERGHQLIVDETTICEITPQSVMVHPYRRRVNLTEQAVEHFSLDAGQTRPVALSASKVSVDLPLTEVTAVSLDRIVVLSPTPGVSGVAIEPLNSRDALPVLASLTERRGLAPRILGAQNYLDLLARMVERTEVVLLRRPTAAWSLEAVLDAVEELSI